MSDDFWGGMFDFNGDGKTTWDEEMLGFAIIEDNIKRNQDNAGTVFGAVVGVITMCLLQINRDHDGNDE